MGQGGWAGSGLGGGQTLRAAASALGNIVFFLADVPGHAPSPSASHSPTTAVLSHSQGFLERGLEGVPPPPLFADTHRPPLGLSLRLLALAFPLSQLFTSAGPVPGRPGSVREHAHLCSCEAPFGARISRYCGTQEGGRGRVENESRMRKSNWESKWLSLGLDPGRGFWAGA